MSRHVINLSEDQDENRSSYAFGWDNMLQSFYLQVYFRDVEEDDNPVVWVGADKDTIMYEVDDLVKVASVHDLEIPLAMQRELYLDKDDGR